MKRQLIKLFLSIKYNLKRILYSSIKRINFDHEHHKTKGAHRKGTSEATNWNSCATYDIRKIIDTSKTIPQNM